MFRSGDWEHPLDVPLLHHAHITMFKYSKTCEQRRCLLKQAVPSEESLKHEVKILCENASIMVACDPPPQDNERSEAMGRYYAPHPPIIP
ncbi:hypothetical protein TNCV_3036891 [Trichonephila clavipes]|nr:hypothetical protein TNCV_3036891 [Trichonephila clavipes]